MLVSSELLGTRRTVLPEGFALTLWDADAIRTASVGAVTEPASLDSKLRPIAGGLWDAKVFGSVPHRDDRCGHLELSVPIVHPLVLQFGRELLLSALDLDPKQLSDVLSGQQWLGPEDEAQRWRSNDQLPAHVDPQWVSGGAALARLYEEAWGDGPLLVHALPVIAPMYRPIVPGSDATFEVSDLDGAYRDIVLWNREWSRLFEAGAPRAAVWHCEWELQRAANVLMHNRDPERRHADDSLVASLVDLAGMGMTLANRLQSLWDADWDGDAHDEPTRWLLAHLHAMGVGLEPVA